MRAPVFFLVPVQACGEHFRVVEDEHILVVEIVEDVFEILAVFDIPALLVEHHQPRLVAVGHGILCDLFFRQFELEL